MLKGPPTTNYPDPQEVCGTIRVSFQDAGFVYTNGSCFAFYQILKTIFPQARAWSNLDHVWTEIDGKWYDIHGIRKEGSKGISPMDEDTALFSRAFQWKHRSSWRVTPQN